MAIKVYEGGRLVGGHREQRLIETHAGLGDFIIYGMFVAPWIIGMRITLGLKFRNDGFWW